MRARKRGRGASECEWREVIREDAGMGDEPSELPWGLDVKKLAKVSCSSLSHTIECALKVARHRAGLSWTHHGLSAGACHWRPRMPLESSACMRLKSSLTTHRVTISAFWLLQGAKSNITSDKIKGFQIGSVAKSKFQKHKEEQEAKKRAEEAEAVRSTCKMLRVHSTNSYAYSLP